MKVLAIGAHHDDVELGVGGTLLKHILAGDEVHLAVTDSDEYRTGHPSIRNLEQLASINAMGIPEKRLHLYGGRYGVDQIIGSLDELQCNLIYAHFKKDTHQAHLRSAKIGHAVGRKPFTQVLFYNSGSAYDFTPTVFSIIDPEKKQVILECFTSQIEEGNIDLVSLNKREAYWASLITKGDYYTEGLVAQKLLHEVETGV